VRVLAATHRPLRADVEAHRFREDLYHRLTQEILRIPPLRTRPEDIDAFIGYWCSSSGPGHGIHVKSEVLYGLHKYNWPGNMRELQSVMRRAAMRSIDGTIGMVELGAALDDHSDTHSTESTPTMPAPNKQYSQCGHGPKINNNTDESRNLLLALEENRWHISRTASAIGVSRSTLYRRMKGLGLMSH
jgi:transcriptional regulator of acetoin/glycerol metabolism